MRLWEKLDQITSELVEGVWFELVHSEIFMHLDAKMDGIEHRKFKDVNG
jgi:hypothetical protein